MFVGFGFGYRSCKLCCDSFRAASVLKRSLSVPLLIVVLRLISRRFRVEALNLFAPKVAIAIYSRQLCA